MTTFAILQPTQLVGQELRQRLGAERQLWQELRLLSTSEEETGTLAEVGGGATLVQRFEPAALEGVDLLFVCGSIGEARPVLAALPANARAVLLCPDAGVEDGVPLVAGVNLGTAPREQVLLSPNPGAVHLAHLLHPLRRSGLSRAVATVLQPASVIGGTALDELFQQARDLLSFQPVTPSGALPHQLVFNLLPTELPAELVSQQLQAVLDSDVRVAAQVVQAGVFHSNAASLYVELDPDPGVDAVRDALAEHAPIELRSENEGQDEDRGPLGPIDAASSEGVLIGPLRRVQQPPGGYWIWSVMDNLTCGGALNALAIAKAALP